MTSLPVYYSKSVLNQQLLSQCAESKVYTCEYPQPAPSTSSAPSGASAAAAQGPLRAAVLKHRFPKAYRHIQLDKKLREQRTIREARALVRARKVGVRTPDVLAASKPECVIVMEYIPGRSVRDVIAEAAETIPAIVLRMRANDVFLRTIKADEQLAGSDDDDEAVGVGAPPAPAISTQPLSNAEVVAGCDLPPAEVEAMVGRLDHLARLGEAVLFDMGAVIGRLHGADIIHGDLTTSNFIAQEGEQAQTTSATSDEGATVAVAAGASFPSAAVRSAPFGVRDIVLIDLGLVRESNNAEERAVDLYVMERAVGSAHPYLTNVSASLLAGYAAAVTDGKKLAATLTRLEAVRARGRKRSMIG